MTISIDMMTDYLFGNPEVSNLVLFQYFGKTRHNTKTDIRESEFISEIARSMNLCQSKRNVTPEASMKVLAMMNAIYNYLSGERFIRSMLDLGRQPYIDMGKKL